MTSTGRNQPCPCGSGQKYKHCCEDKDKHPYVSRTGIISGIAIAIVLAGGIAALLNDPSNDAETQRRLRDVLEGRSETAAPAPVSPAPAATPAPAGSSQTPTTSTGLPGAPVPQPDGPVPAGKVWSAEHGHWHDAPTVQVDTNSEALSGNAAPGQPQPGLVWNEEHGHYHKVDDSVPVAGAQSGDAASPATIPRSEIPRVSVSTAGQVQSTRPIMPPAGPAPEGKVWSYEHGHWHDAQPAFPSGDIPDDSSTSESTSTREPE